MSLVPPFEQTLITHTQRLYVCNILGSFGEENFQKFALNLSLAFISEIM